MSAHSGGDRVDDMDAAVEPVRRRSGSILTATWSEAHPTLGSAIAVKSKARSTRISASRSTDTITQLEAGTKASFSGQGGVETAGNLGKDFTSALSVVNSIVAAPADTQFQRRRYRFWA
jgi:hypothetical protein